MKVKIHTGFRAAQAAIDAAPPQPKAKLPASSMSSQRTPAAQKRNAKPAKTKGYSAA